MDVRRLSAKGVFVGTVFTLVLTFAAPNAYAVDYFYLQDGRQTNGIADIDGNYARIDGGAFNPSSSPYSCVVYSVAVQDTGRQLEAGLVRCAGSPGYLDATAACDDAVFVELTRSGNSDCHAHGSISNDAYYTFRMKRESSTSHTFDPYLFSSETHYPGDDLGNFGSTPWLESWGEHVGRTIDCSGWGDPADGYFQDWQGFKYGTGWYYLSPARYHNQASQCWAVNNIDGTGDYSVIF